MKAGGLALAKKDNVSAHHEMADDGGHVLPSKLSPDGLLIGYSLDEELHRPIMGFQFGDAIEDEDADDGMLEPILHTGDGHLITLARTGAGKGVGCIIPALLRYRGPAIVIDPKGENYQVTARRRREMGHEVRVLDPFGVTSTQTDALNPLDLINPRSPEAIDDAAQLAELLVAASSNRDPFWDSRAYSLVTTMLLFVASARPPVLRNLGELHYLLNQSPTDMDFTFKEMARSPLSAVQQGCAVKETAEAKVWASILSTAQAHTDFLRSAGAHAAIGQSTIDLNHITSGKPLSIYIVVPPEKLESHGKLLRLWIGVLMSAITRRNRRPDLPTLFVLDEAAQLGELKQLRQAITLLRGYGLRIWSFWQDLSQLKMLYPRDWQTMINNCEVLQSFGFANASVARSGSELTGYPDWQALQDLEYEEMVVALAGDRPIIARKPNYLKDPAFTGQFDANGFYSDEPMGEVHEFPRPSIAEPKSSLAELKRARERERCAAQASGAPGSPGIAKPKAGEPLDKKFDLSGDRFAAPDDIPNPFKKDDKN